MMLVSTKAETTSRIPKFGARPAGPATVTGPSHGPLTACSVGNPVRVGTKTGILRYVGRVHFAEGPWCGVELFEPLGKNDGAVEGVRYFACAERRGLMAPLAKAQLIHGIPSSAPSSGPHSMLFVEEATKRRRVADDADAAAEIDPVDDNIPKATPESVTAARKSRLSILRKESDEENSNSMEFNETLGILTPDQMDGTLVNMDAEHERTFLQQFIEAQSPNVPDLSLGILDEALLNFTLSNTHWLSSDAGKAQTPTAVEELPLDPAPSAGDAKQPAKCGEKNSSSITSITSLDIGYQGDGENSRPESRGADAARLTRRSRRPEPMTDSDFYTESDADNHEEQPVRGDRRAQVIDGTLYGVDPQAAADIYVNNRENMDSSGIFTDMEKNEDASPDASSKTITENTQTFDGGDRVDEDKAKKRVVGDAKDSGEADGSPKKPKAATAKGVSKPVGKPSVGETGAKASAGRWSTVLDKMNKHEQKKIDYKVVKSKVFASLDVNSTGNPRTTVAKKPAVHKTPNNKQTPQIIRGKTTPKYSSCTVIYEDADGTPKNKQRSRTIRPKSAQTPKSTIHSSQSDVSAATPPLSHRKPGSAKKRTDVSQVTQVLTANKLPARNQQKTAVENKKNILPHLSSKTETKSPKNVHKSKETFKPSINSSAKESPRSTIKAERSQIVRSQSQANPHHQQPLITEALAVLVQHLVFNVGAYEVPSLRRQLEKLAKENGKIKEALEEEKNRSVREVSELNRHYADVEQRLVSERENDRRNLSKQHEEEVEERKKEFRQSLEIVREENDSILEQIQEKSALIEKLKYESKKLKEDYESKETLLLGNVHKLKQHNAQLEEKLKRLAQENDELKKRNSFIEVSNEESCFASQDVHSLTVVLRMKQDEMTELRKELNRALQKVDELVGIEEKARYLNDKCEGLEFQLDVKNSTENGLQQEIFKLKENLKEEQAQRKRILLHNEELLWKLRQNKEVMTKVVEQADGIGLNRSKLSASCRESNSRKMLLERSLSLREKMPSRLLNGKEEESRKFFDDSVDETTPKVKIIVEKSDSVSYMLEMNEDPDAMASRFINRMTSTPKFKRPRIKNQPRQSPISSSVPNDFQREPVIELSPMWRDGHDLDDADDDDLTELPALPDVLGGGGGAAEALPAPRHLAGEAMASENNSEDESTSSSQL
ncbi:unnamed protein product [Phyllotreta striolata]|uniref:CAP-Gly domain-containing protein n=1 Tax=Phyllotreta striolata TaxID=444603 RepID=A0A9P0E014_PHYSR|nr:unnamed protein product [Phyllotreta striolata]